MRQRATGCGSTSNGVGRRRHASGASFVAASSIRVRGGVPHPRREERPRKRALPRVGRRAARCPTATGSAPENVSSGARARREALESVTSGSEDRRVRSPPTLRPMYRAVRTDPKDHVTTPFGVVDRATVDVQPCRPLCDPSHREETTEPVFCRKKADDHFLVGLGVSEHTC